MRSAHDDPELLELWRRYGRPGRRYLKLGGSVLRLAPTERARLARSLGEDAASVTDAELSILFEGGWRECRTAAWLVAVDRRTAFRDRIRELLFTTDTFPTAASYCVALVRFGAAADADLLVAYLDEFLLRPDVDYGQEPALASLLYLGDSRAARFLRPDGAWSTWVAAATHRAVLTPDSSRAHLAALVGFAEQSAG